MNLLPFATPLENELFNLCQDACKDTQSEWSTIHCPDVLPWACDYLQPEEPDYLFENPHNLPVAEETDAPCGNFTNMLCPEQLSASSSESVSATLSSGSSSDQQPEESPVVSRKRKNNKRESKKRIHVKKENGYDSFGEYSDETAPPSDAEVESKPNLTNSTGNTLQFTLVQDLHAHQRKSYLGESRWMQPLPEIVCCDNPKKCEHSFKGDIKVRIRDAKTSNLAKGVRCESFELGNQNTLHIAVDRECKSGSFYFEYLITYTAQNQPQEQKQIIRTRTFTISSH